jgi:hypothetical protein
VDTSRSVLQPTAELSKIGQFSLDQQRIIIHILFAARNLVDVQFARSAGRVICTECLTEQISDRKLEHADWCRTGRMKRLLAELLDVPNPTERKNAQAEKSCEPVDAAVEEQPRSRNVPFYEPWTVDAGLIKDAQGAIMVDPLGSDLSVADEWMVMRRIVACVNACTGISTYELERKGGVQ